MGRVSVAGVTCPFSFFLLSSTLLSSQGVSRSKYLVLGQYEQAGASETNPLQATDLI